jgi:Ca2+:H+ antiporter
VQHSRKSPGNRLFFPARIGRIAAGAGVAGGHLILQRLRKEWFLGFSLVSVLVFALGGTALFAHLPETGGFALLFLWLFAAVLGSCLNVVRHADGIAEILGEPYGTLVLTLSVTTIEVLGISAVMLHGDNNPALVRDTLFSVVMVILGGMAGLSLLLGGWRHREQPFNLQGANSYLGVIIPLAVLSLVLPNFTRTTEGPMLSAMQQLFIALMCAGLYCAFLALQTGRHKDYFTAAIGAPHHVEQVHEMGALLRHAVLLLAYILPVAFLAEAMAHPIDYLIETLHAPAVLGGVIIAIIVATPEAVGALRAAMANQLQLAVNIFLGSVLSTIGLTVPVMLVISHLTGHPVFLGLPGTDQVLLLLTLAVSVVTFSSGRTNIMQGAVHVVLFAAFLLMMFDAS